jgi:succinylglutamic semialdehyde dehydrogenase
MSELLLSVKDVLGFEAPKFLGSYFAGRWHLPVAANGVIEVHSPANLDWALAPVSFSYRDVDLAVDEAQRAQRDWALQPMETRIAAIRAFKAELEKRKDQIAKLISFEIGKPYKESLGEAGALLSKIDVTIEHGLELIKSSKVDMPGGGTAEMHYRPIGVLAVIGPFNFPVHLSNGHIIPALLVGNTVILKPSERAPYCAQLYMEAAHAAGLPKGVLSMLHGDPELATRLIRHTGIRGVLATCSYEVGTKILRTLADQTQKIVALEMGGKNAAIVDSNVTDLDKVASALIESSFLTTGQRCTALSRVYVIGDHLDELCDLVHRRAKDLVISHPFDVSPEPFMGPLVSGASRENFLKYHNIAMSEGAEVIMRPKALETKALLTGKKLPKGFYVNPSIHRVASWSASSTYQTHEIFGPDLFFAPASSLDDAIAAANSTDYGLSFSYFGEKKEDYLYVADRVQAGLIYFNRPTVGASGRLPFGGWGHSGNFRPAGLFAIYSSSQAQARIF